MVREQLYEESAVSNSESKEQKLYTFFLVLSVICFAVAGIILFYSVMAIQSFLFSEQYTTFGRIFNIVSLVAIILVFAGLGVIFWFVKRRFNRSYDYSFVEDELRVTRVFNGRSRKYLLTIPSDRILKIGWCDKPSFADTQRGLRNKPVRLTPNRTPADGKEFVYLLVSGTLGNTLYILECRRELLEHLVKAAGVTKLVRE